MKMKLIGVVMVSLGLALFGFVAVSNAQSFQTGQLTTVKSGQVIDGSAYMSGSTIDVAGTVDGDLYCTGQNVTISGTINGDVLCAAQTINLTGTVSGNIRVAGQIVNVGGVVGGSASIASQTVTIESQGNIARDVTLISQNATVKGQVLRDLVVGSGALTLDGIVGRNVTATINSLNVESRAAISGTLDYTSPQVFTKAEGATIAGVVNYTEQKQEATANAKSYNPAVMILWALMLIVSAIIFALLFPRLLLVVSSNSVALPSKALVALFVGFAASVLVPFIIVLFMATVVAIPFAILLLVAWCFIVLLSGVFAAYYIGRIVWKSQNNIILATLLGAIIISFLLIIPILNVFVTILSVSYGSGVLLVYIKNRFETPKYTIAAAQPKRKIARK